MQPRQFFTFAAAALLSVFISCSNKKEKESDSDKDVNKESTQTVNEEPTGPESWIGNYKYEEKPVESNAGYNMVMVWTLSIAMQNDSLQGILEVDGQQTFIKMITNIRGDGNSISVTFNRMVDGMDQNLTSNMVLFVLRKEDKTITTSFDAMVPRLSENPLKVCECFEKTQ